METAALRMRLLGRFEVEGVEPSSLGSRKGRTLLKRLALDAGNAVPVDTLVATLWPDDAAPARPAEQVSVLVSRLRRALGPAAISYGDGAYALGVDWLDVDELRRRTEEAARRLADGSPALSRAAASAALALLRGPLLAEDLDEPWTQAARAAVDRLAAHARHVAAEGALAGGLSWEAAEHAAAALAADPYDEAALRLLMQAHVAAGRPALALAAYAETAAVVAADLGVDLDPRSRALHLAVLRGETAKPQAGPPAAGAPLIGRESELAALTAALDRALAGSGVIVAVEGEAGIGKSRLLSAFAERAARSAQVLRASAVTVGVLPMEPIIELLARRLSGVPDDERAALLGAEAEVLDPLLRPGRVSSPIAYRDLLVAYEPGEQSAPAVLHIALLAVVARLCAQRPVVVLLDDAHLLDAATVSWLGLVARHGTDLRLLVVAAHRPVDHAIPASVAISLGRLAADAAAAIVAGRVDSARLAAVVERSAGLPLFLVELAEATGDTLPDTIRESVVARIADAGTAAATIRAAAVLGSEVDVDLLASVLDRPTVDLLDDLEDAARRRILDDAPTGYVFHHELIREALEVDTATARRAWLHRQAAHALARRVPTEQLRVAHHARLGGEAALAAKALCAAAAQAGARFDHDAALSLAADSLRLADSADAHLIRGRSFVLLRQYADARAEAEQAGALGAGVEAPEVAAFAAYYSRDLDAVLRLADEAVAAAEGPEEMATCQFLAAKVLHTRGQISAAEHRLSAIAQSSPGSRIASFAGTWRSFVHLHRGHVEEAAQSLASSDSARLAPVPYAPLYVEQFLAHLAGLAGRPLDAVAAAERLQHLAAEQHAVRFLGRAEVYRGWALGQLCVPSAADDLEAACEVARAAGNPEPLGQGSLDLVTLHLDAGRLDAAVTALDRVSDVLAGGLQVSNAWRIELRATYLRGRLAVLRAHPGAGAEAAGAVVARARADGMQRYEVLGSLLAIEAALAAGERVAVEDVTSRLAELCAVARPEAWRLAARLGHALGSAELLAWSGERAAELVLQAGPHAAHVRRAVAEVLSPDR